MLTLAHTERTLAALADASRLRLLAACAVGERAVGELARALAQSEPRVSRHLKILAEAGLVERRRAGHRVCYRAVTHGDPAEIMRIVLARLDAGTGALRRDAARLATERGASPEVPLPRESRLGRAMRECMRPALGLVGEGGALVVGVWHLELLEAVARLSRHATAVAASQAAVDVARAWLDAQAPRLACEVVTEVPTAPEPWATVVIDRTLDTPTGLELPLQAAAGWLVPGGRLWIFDRYDGLETLARAALGHPLALLRRLLVEGGFNCDRIQPLDTDGMHVLAVLATRAAGAGAGDPLDGAPPIPVRRVGV